MYGSQLIAVKSHNIGKSTPGVGDSKSQDSSITHSDLTPQPTPPISKSLISSKSMMSKTSKELAITGKAESGTDV